MRLPETIREQLQAEFRIAADRIAATPDLPGKLYFFSAFFGEANRALNRHWDAELALIHLILVGAHGEMMGRLSQPQPIGATLSGLPDELPEALTRVANNLADLFEQPEQDSTRLYGVMSRLAEVAYTATGNGYYLYLKGTVSL